MSESVYAKFKIYAPPIKKECTLNEDGTLTIVGIASTTSEDLDGEIVSEQALNSMVKQAIGLNLHLDHNHHYDGGIGVIIDAKIINNSLWITAKILKEFAQGIKERLDLGMNFGFSIGGLPLIDNRNSNVFVDVNLLEVSLTLLPANWDTFGTVMSTKGIVESNCLTGACHYILKNKREDIMRKDESGTLTEEEIQQVIDIVEESAQNLRTSICEDVKNELLPIIEDVVTQTIEPFVALMNENEEELPEDELQEKEEELPEEETEVVEEEKEEETEIIEEEKEEEIEESPLDEKAINLMVERIFNKLNKSKETVPSKYKKYNRTKRTKSSRKFLDEKTRDKYGRNKKYI